MKVHIGVTASSSDLDELSNLGNKSELIREAAKKCEQNPKLVAKIVEKVINREEGDEPERKTGLSMEVEDVEVLDRLAKRAIATRNTIIQWIMKGILSGVVR